MVSVCIRPLEDAFVKTATPLANFPLKWIVVYILGHKEYYFGTTSRSLIKNKGNTKVKKSDGKWGFIDRVKIKCEIDFGTFITTKPTA